MRFNLSTIYLWGTFLVISICFSCSTPNQTSINSNSAKVSVENRLANKNSSNKPVNIAEENFKKEWKSKYEATVATLEKNRLLWESSKNVNYDFICGKPGTGAVTDGWTRLAVLIKVRNGEQISIEKVEKDNDYVRISRTDGFEDFDTIDKLFKYLREELEKGRMIWAEYNKKYGYPQEVGITYSYEIHGGVGIRISKLQVVK